MMRRLTLTIQFGALALAEFAILAALLVEGTATFVVLGALLVLLGVLVFVVSRASKRLERQAAENEHQAMHDSLTNLPNRTLFRDRVEQQLLSARREEAAFAVLIMDLDRFKEINDTLGHRNGDLILQAIGPRLRARLRDVDSIARFGPRCLAILIGCS